MKRHQVLNIVILIVEHVYAGCRYAGRHDTQYNDIHHNGTHHDDVQHNNDENATLSTMAKHWYAKGLLCSASLMLNVKCKRLLLNVIVLNVVKLSVIMLSIVMLNVVISNVMATLYIQYQAEIHFEVICNLFFKLKNNPTKNQKPKQENNCLKLPQMSY